MTTFCFFTQVFSELYKITNELENEDTALKEEGEAIASDGLSYEEFEALKDQRAEWHEKMNKSIGKWEMLGIISERLKKLEEELKKEENH